MRISVKALLIAALVGGAASNAQAHYPWLTVDKDGKAVLYFGETPAEKAYKLPASIATAKVFTIEADHSQKPVELSEVDTDDFIGLASKQPVSKDASLACEVSYGIYHGTLLTYHLQHQGKLSSTHKAESTEGKGLAASIVDTDTGVDVYVTFDGKPLEKAEVKLFCEEGHQEGDAKTDKDGKVSFTDKQVEEGLNAVLVGTTLDDKSGELNGKQYKSESHYLTATFQDPHKD